MAKNKLKRFSKEWWFCAILILSVCVFAFLFYRLYLGGENKLTAMLFLLLLVIVFEPFWALGFELIAPNKVIIGPGERRTNECEVSEVGKVLSGFGDLRAGRVRVFGEDWSAIQNSGDTSQVVVGDKVSIVDRDGITLIVKSATKDAK